MKVNLSVLLVVSGFLVGCAHLSVDPEEYLAGLRQQMVRQHKEPAYVDGYIDGCSTGRRLAGNTAFPFRKLISRFDRDVTYASGWQDGRKYCLKKAPELDRKIFGKQDEKELTQKRQQLEKERDAIEAEQYKIWQELKK